MPTYRNDGNETLSVVDIYGNTVFVVPGFSVKTYSYMDSVLTRTGNDPYYPLALINKTVSVSGTASETGLISCKTIRLYTTAEGILVRVDSADSTYPMTLLPDQPQDIVNRGEINSLHFSGTGDVLLIGFFE